METIGGILADDMGLGKTLSVLATIIRSIEAGRLFASGKDKAVPINGEEDVPGKIFSRATLVIVPSSSMSSFRYTEVSTHFLSICCSS